MMCCRRAGITAVLAMTVLLATGAGSPQQFALPPELIDVLDLAPPALRYVPGPCCGAELGAIYDIPGRPTTRYQFFITGTHIGIQSPQATTNAAPVESIPSVRLIATGAANGEAFRMEIVAGAGSPGRFIAPDGLVLEPLSTPAPSTPPGTNTIATSLEGFATDFSKDPPPAGTMYRVADARQQERLKSIRYLMRAADGLASTRRLHPDGDPTEYLNFIKQWAIWTRIEQWDLREFDEAFTRRSRRTLESLRQPWTRDVEQRVRALVPGRWGDVQAVLTTAEMLVKTPRR
jgi:hypothetical protein